MFGVHSSYIRRVGESWYRIRCVPSNHLIGFEGVDTYNLFWSVPEGCELTNNFPVPESETPGLVRVVWRQLKPPHRPFLPKVRWLGHQLESARFLTRWCNFTLGVSNISFKLFLGQSIECRTRHQPPHSRSRNVYFPNAIFEGPLLRQAVTSERTLLEPFQRAEV